MNLLAGTGRALIDSTRSAGRTTLLFLDTLVRLPQVVRTLRQLGRQIDMSGIGSLLVLSMIAGLTGMIMVMQMGPALETYNAISTIGGVIGVTFTRELGPIWAAVIVLARVGSAMAAELGTMAVNEEVEALKVMNVDPVRYLVLPRILALVLVMPVLTTLADLASLAGGAFIANSRFDVPYQIFQESVQQFVGWKDYLGGLAKSVVFGATIGTIACAQGLATEGGAEGVGRSTTNTVRLCVIFTLIGDLVMTEILRLVLQEGSMR